MAEEIIIEIDPHGDVKVEGVGIAGPDCVKLTKELEDALGKVQKRTMKPDYHRTRALLRKATS